MSQSNVLQVDELRVYFQVKRTSAGETGLAGPRFETLRAVDGVSFGLRRGETLALVGESGSGKSTVARAIVGLVRPVSGRVLFDGIAVNDLAPGDLRALRSRMQIIFQNPVRSLSPRMRVGKAIAEPLLIHGKATSKADAMREVDKALEEVGLLPAQEFSGRFPHQLSGGQQQRVVIARSLVTRPDLIIADEALASADATMRIRLIDLLLDLKHRLGLTYLFITHDLAQARLAADRVAIMYLGRIVEIGPIDRVFGDPEHPYTQALLGAASSERRESPRLRGEIPSPTDPPPGCPLHPRCPLAVAGVCEVVEPQLDPSLGNAEHLVACHLAPGHRPLSAAGRSEGENGTAPSLEANQGRLQA